VVKKCLRQETLHIKLFFNFLVIFAMGYELTRLKISIILSYFI